MRWPITPTRLRTCVVIIIGILATGCSSDEAATTRATPVDSETAPTQVEEVLSPTVEFFAGGRSGAENANLVERSVADCMQQRGWEYEPIIQDESGQLLTVEEMEAYVRKYGFGYFSFPEPSGRTRSATEANQRYWETLSESQRLEYAIDMGDGDLGTGAPPEGRKPSSGSCRGQAEQATGLPLYNDDLMDRMRQLYVASRESPEVAAARLAYRACMRLRGYQVTQPSDAQDLALAQGEGLPELEAVTQELEIAMADFECHKGTILPVDQVIESGIVETLIEEFPTYAP